MFFKECVSARGAGSQSAPSDLGGVIRLPEVQKVTGGSGMERKRWECSALPQGWKKEEVTRRSGLSAGKSDVYYYRCLFFYFLTSVGCRTHVRRD